MDRAERTDSSFFANPGTPRELISSSAFRSAALIRRAGWRLDAVASFISTSASDPHFTSPPHNFRATSGSGSRGMLLSCGNGAKGIVSRNCRGYEDVCLGGCSSRRAKDRLLCNGKLWSFDSHRPLTCLSAGRWIAIRIT